MSPLSMCFTHGLILNGLVIFVPIRNKDLPTSKFVIFLQRGSADYVLRPVEILCNVVYIADIIMMYHILGRHMFLKSPQTMTKVNDLNFWTWTFSLRKTWLQILFSDCCGGPDRFEQHCEINISSSTAHFPCTPSSLATRFVFHTLVFYFFELTSQNFPLK